MKRALLAVAGLALAAAAVLATGVNAPERVTDAPRVCPNVIPMRQLSSDEGGSRFVVEHVQGAPWNVSELRHRVEVAGTSAEVQDAPPPEGPLAEGGEDAPVRFVENAGGAGTVDPGDEIVLRARGAFNLVLLDASGAPVGGTWACL